MMCYAIKIFKIQCYHDTTHYERSGIELNEGFILLYIYS